MEDAIEKALNAGVDILVFANNNGRFYKASAGSEALTIIKKLIAEGKITKERIEQSYARIQALKQQL